VSTEVNALTVRAERSRIILGENSRSDSDGIQPRPGEKQAMANLRDVAKAAGVSVATVSNVLNGRLDRVSTETRERVLAAVRALKYRPTPLEKGQQAILSHNLGVLIPDLTEHPITRQGYFRNVLDGILEAAAFRGWSITIFVQRMWDDVGHVVRRSYDGRCDGIIIVAPQPGNEVVQTLSDRGSPVVQIGSTPWLPHVSSVDIDNLAVGARAAQHLIGLGHRNLAYVGHRSEQISSAERREAFFEEATRHGIPEPDLTFFAIPRERGGLSEAGYVARRIQELSDCPTGIFCWHDGLGVPLVNEFSRLGMRVPEQFSVLSVDDSPESETSSPPLTSFCNPLPEIGKRAARMIIDRLTEGMDAAEVVRFAPELIVRSSTGPAPAPRPAFLR
jgi:LacI family transcriptional regulator